MRVAPLDSSWIGRKLGIIFAPTRNRPDPGPEAIHRSHPGYPETRAAWHSGPVLVQHYDHLEFRIPPADRRTNWVGLA
jgi:hypothetical protein